jgi:uncharacterized membrane protein
MKKLFFFLFLLILAASVVHGEDGEISLLSFSLVLLDLILTLLTLTLLSHSWMWLHGSISPSLLLHHR